MMKNLTKEVNEISQLPHYCEYLMTEQSPFEKLITEADNESHFTVLVIVIPFFTELSQEGIYTVWAFTDQLAKPIMKKQV